jgi:hypothetical protein
MTKGFKDKDGKFRPTGNSNNGISSDDMIGKYNVSDEERKVIDEINKRASNPSKYYSHELTPSERMANQKNTDNVENRFDKNFQVDLPLTKKQAEILFDEISLVRGDKATDPEYDEYSMKTYDNLLKKLSNYSTKLSQHDELNHIIPRFTKDEMSIIEHNSYWTYDWYGEQNLPLTDSARKSLNTDAKFLYQKHGFNSQKELVEQFMEIEKKAWDDRKQLWASGYMYNWD